MLEFSHSLTGAFIAYTIPNPIISLPASLLSHFVLDLFPHWNPSLSEDKKKFGQITKKTFLLVIVDSSLGLFLGLLVAFRKIPDVRAAAIVIAGCFFAVLPDLLEAPFYFLDWKNSRLKWLTKFHSEHQFKVPFWPGMIFQVFFTTLLLALI